MSSKYSLQFIYGNRFSWSDTSVLRDSGEYKVLCGDAVCLAHAISSDLLPLCKCLHAFDSTCNMPCINDISSSHWVVHYVNAIAIALILEKTCKSCWCANYWALMNWMHHMNLSEQCVPDQCVNTNSTGFFLEQDQCPIASLLPWQHLPNLERLYLECNVPDFITKMLL